MKKAWRRRTKAGLPGLAGRHPHRQRSVAIGLTAFLLPLTIAVASLVLEDLLPKGDNPSTTRARLLVLLGGLIALVGAAVWLNYLGTRRGTLFYVRLIDSHMHDWHSSAHELAVRDMLASRVIAEPITMMPGNGDVIDVQEHLATARRDLQQAFNSDDRRTGYHVAPNMLWPVAFGLGYDLTAPAGLTLVDFGFPVGEASVGAFEWALDNLRREIPAGFRSLEKADKAGTDESGPMLVAATMTNDPDLARFDYLVGKSIRVGIFKNGNPVAVSVGTDAGAGVVHPARATEDWVAAIREALHSTAGRVVLLVAKVPKTVALAGGNLLANPGSTGPRSDDPGCGYQNCANESCRQPWRFLVPMHYDIPQKKWFPVRVHPDQPDLGAQIERLSKGRT
jgi:hypothetical protein